MDTFYGSVDILPYRCKESVEVFLVSGSISKILVVSTVKQKYPLEEFLDGVCKSFLSYGKKIYPLFYGYNKYSGMCIQHLSSYSCLLYKDQMLSYNSHIFQSHRRYNSSRSIVVSKTRRNYIHLQ